MGEIKRYRASELAKLPADSDDVVLSSAYDALQKRCEQLEEALRQGSLQLEMAADCIENRRYDEALLHCRSLVRLREAALSKGSV